ncbi:MAG: glutamine amidotransferase [Verrucomicrobiota bacterium]
MIDYTYLPATRWLIAAGLTAAALIVTSYLSGKGRASWPMRLILSLVRCLTVAGIAFCLLDPEWIEAIKHQPKSRVAVLLDTSRSMSIKDLPQQRLAAAKAWLEHDLKPVVPGNVGVQYQAFSDALTPLANVASAQIVTNGGTGLADALENLLSLPNDDPLASVLLCSDGIENRRRDVDSIARLYRRKGIPIHTLTVGTTNDQRDVIVENVQVRRAVPNQAPTKVNVHLRAPGYSKETVPIQIFHDDELVAAKDVVLTGAAQNVELDFTPRQKGFQVYEIRVPAQRDEWLATNNRRLFGIEVIDPTIRVLYMEGTPQQPNSPIPEWKYLKSALESDPDIKVKVLYREFGANGKRLQVVTRDPETGEKVYPVEHPTKGFPRTLNGLLEYDVIIHSDIRKESFTNEELQNMQRLVEEFGGGFVMIGGNSAFGKGGYHRTILDRIIPVAMHQENDSQARPFYMNVPVSAWTHPIIALGATPQETQLIWTKKMPPLYGCNLVDRAKPGATVLANDPTAPTARGPRLILAVQSVGHGRSMAFTSDTTRTWGKDFETLWGEKITPGLPLTEENCDSRYYRQFWANAIRWLAAARVGRTNNAVTLELTQSYCSPNEKVPALVQVRSKDGRDLTTADVALLVASNRKTNVVAKAIYDGSKRAFVADLTLPAAGTFTVTAVAAAAGTKLGDDRQLLVCEAADREMVDLRARPESLATIARLSGGKALSLADSDAPAIESVFYNAPPATVDYRRTPLWDKSWILAVLLGLLSAEWALRRLKGLA